MRQALSEAGAMVGRHFTRNTRTYGYSTRALMNPRTMILNIDEMPILYTGCLALFYLGAICLGTWQNHSIRA